MGMKAVGLLGTEGLNREKGWEYREEEGSAEKDNQRIYRKPIWVRLYKVFQRRKTLVIGILYGWIIFLQK